MKYLIAILIYVLDIIVVPALLIFVLIGAICVFVSRFFSWIELHISFRGNKEAMNKEKWRGL